MATALDYRPPSNEATMDSRVVALMKQYGIWHPAVSISPGTEKQPNPQYAHEQALMQHIQDMVSRQDAVNENTTARTQQTQENRTSRETATSEAEKGRNERAQAVQEARKQQLQDQKTQGLVTALGHLDPGSPEHKAILQQYLKAQGIEIPTTVDPKTAAAAAFAKSKGLPVASTTSAPPTPSGFAPSQLVTPPTQTPQDKTAQTYGVSVATPDMLPANVIAQKYGGKSEIPNDGAPGYYKDGQFVGPFSGGYVLGSTGVKGDRNDPTGVPMGKLPALVNTSPAPQFQPSVPTQPQAPASFPVVNALVQPAPPNNLVQGQPPAPVWWPPGQEAGTTGQVLGTAPQQPSIANKPEMQDLLARFLSATLFKKGNPWQ